MMFLACALLISLPIAVIVFALKYEASSKGAVESASPKKQTHTVPVMYSLEKKNPDEITMGYPTRMDFMLSDLDEHSTSNMGCQMGGMHDDDI